MEAYWHIYHNQLLSFSDNIRKRIEYIKQCKPECELKRRLELLKPVRGKLPRAITELGEAWEKTRIAYEKAWIAVQEAWMTHPKVREACERGQMTYEEALTAYITKVAYAKAGEAYHKIIRAYQVEVKALHAKECPNSPWDGRTIFPGEEEA